MTLFTTCKFRSNFPPATFLKASSRSQVT